MHLSEKAASIDKFSLWDYNTINLNVSEDWEIALRALELILRPFLIVFFKIFLKVPGHRVLMRPFAKRFIAGETLEEALDKARELAQQGFKLTIGYVGEEEYNPARIRGTELIYLSLLDAIARERLPANIAVKRSQFNCTTTQGGFFNFLRLVVKRAYHHRIIVRVDAERLSDRDLTFNVAYALQRIYGNTCLAVQAYAEDAIIFLVRKVIPSLRGDHEPFRIGICKGAYHEPVHLVFRRQKDIVDNFRRMAIVLSEVTNTVICLETHDEANLLRPLIQLLRRKGKKPEEYEIGMLLGVEEGLAKKLVEEGECVRIYLAFGWSWDHFVARRVIEKPRYIFYAFRKN